MAVPVDERPVPHRLVDENVAVDLHRQLHRQRRVDTTAGGRGQDKRKRNADADQQPDDTTAPGKADARDRRILFAADHDLDEIDPRSRCPSVETEPREPATPRRHDRPHSAPQRRPAQQAPGGVIIAECRVGTAGHRDSRLPIHSRFGRSTTTAPPAMPATRSLVIGMSPKRWPGIPRCNGAKHSSRGGLGRRE